MKERTFVLLHGAFHGGWCWVRVAEALRAEGHRVFTPTQTGLGERRHLLSSAITLETFINDLINLFTFEDLSDTVLVGHSFAGSVIAGMADR
ncbi:MAG TPA: alpha/beta fold hydrolase, partial [Acetobacteraceae bacterium]|nr:alpha/beta fold hydrolase [Acetobacteraceae bacterium]